ncbi:MAG TPA: DUF4215 domain-containing protein, partial [Kofleriaceae bacterium]|nr:DUF4215 domain-containing protein [Kofleriaceae bacterium]
MKTRLLVTTSLFLFACGDNLSSVPEPVCGDGVVEGQEACDDGNDVDSDGCSSSCTLAVCGDGKLDFNEGCDDGNTSNADGCDSNCVQTFCGNGVKSGDEQCDDNNTISGDGCDNNCKITACGNGVMTTGETCDDGNAVEGDGCDSNCTTSACGNGIVANNEQCDDGNTATADGCSGSCRTEASEIEPNEDGSVSTGGTGIVGNDFAIAAADTNGAFTGSKTILAKIDPAGDEDVFKLTNTGTVPVRLKLDTWNLAMNFGIGVSCGTASIDTGINVRNAAGTVLVSNNDRASGDRCAGLVTGLLPGDTVYAHVTELGDNAAIASYALDVQFIPVVCGDGDVGPGEQCDDMNTAVGDGCSATCQIEGGVSEIEPNEDGTPSTGGNGIAGNDFGSANATANGVISASTTYIASLTPAGDEDVFAFTNAGTTGTVVQLDVWGLGSGFGIGVPCGTAIDTGMHVRNAAGLSLVFNDDRSGNTDRCSTITLNLFPGETRFAHVSEYDDDDVVTQYALQVKYTPVVCGDSTVGFTETCDDGNTTAGDGCSATCQVEPVCANSSVEPPEQCDDGNMTAGDGCSATCQLENAMTEIEPNEDGSVSTGGFGIVGNDFGTAAPDANGAITTSKRVLAQINPAGDEDVFALHNPGSTYVTVKLDVWNVALTYGIGVSCGSAIDTGLQVKTAAGS